jgi:hypothetical protein
VIGLSCGVEYSNCPCCGVVLHHITMLGSNKCINDLPRRDHGHWHGGPVEYVFSNEGSGTRFLRGPVRQAELFHDTLRSASSTIVIGKHRAVEVVFDAMFVPSCPLQENIRVRLCKKSIVRLGSITQPEMQLRNLTIIKNPLTSQCKLSSIWYSKTVKHAPP